MKKKPNRNPASRYLDVVEKMKSAMVAADVSGVAAAKLIGIGHVTLFYYLTKQRNIKQPEIAARITATAELLNEMVDAGIFPLGEGVNSRLKTAITFERVDEFVRRKERGE